MQSPRDDRTGDTMSTKSVAGLMVETLTRAGVKRIYGVVGDSLNGLTDVLRRQEAIAWVHVRHEEVAAFAAAGEAQVTGDARRLRGVLWPRQSASHQWSLRRASQPHAGSRHRRANPILRDRWWVFPGNPSAESVSRVQSLLRACLGCEPASLCAGKRDAGGGRIAGGRRGGGPRRRRPCGKAPKRAAFPRRLGVYCRRHRRSVPDTDATWKRSPTLLERRRARHPVLADCGCAGAHAPLMQLAETC